MRQLHGPAVWLRIYIGEADHWQGKPLYQALVELLHERGLAGATVLRGVEGFGAHSRIHTARILRMSEDLPLVVEAVDTREQIEALLPTIDAMLGDGLVTLTDVQVVSYRGGSGTHEPPA
jgi:uncharacterized protein